MPIDIKDAPINISYDIIHNIYIGESNKNKKKLGNMKKLPNKKDISALSLISKYLNNA